jgi:hypothetical protein
LSHDYITLAGHYFKKKEAWSLLKYYPSFLAGAARATVSRHGSSAPRRTKRYNVLLGYLA